MNIALAEIGSRVQINSLADATTEAKTANLMVLPKLRMLARTAIWDSFRAQIALTVLKQAVVNGEVSANPPPQPWMQEYAYPSDCLKFRFIRPTVNLTQVQNLTTNTNQVYPYPKAPNARPFVVATDYDANNNPIKVILANI
ncbi:MAG TPA: hypothetical protein VNF04_12240, partial [Stellaceae bacterium]|nr:hypothetical protein [Stellaceae bacterium]